MLTKFFCLAVAICTPTLLVGPEGVAAQGLEVLRHYEGQWDCKFEIVSQEQGGQSQSFTGEAEGKWVLDSKFLEQTGRYRLGDSSQPMEIRTMMTFDQPARKFKYYYFDSSGQINTSTGKWDPAAKVMTSTFDKDENGNTTTIRADFSTESIERWTIETTNPEGQSILKIAGTNQRK